jgi:hypothetical protein
MSGDRVHQRRSTAHGPEKSLGRPAHDSLHGLTGKQYCRIELLPLRHDQGQQFRHGLALRDALVHHHLDERRRDQHRENSADDCQQTADDRRHDPQAQQHPRRRVDEDVNWIAAFWTACSVSEPEGHSQTEPEDH